MLNTNYDTIDREIQGTSRWNYVDTSVTTLPPGSDAACTIADVTMSNGKKGKRFSFSIPKGATGSVENMPYSNVAPMPVSGFASAGTSENVSRADHTHANLVNLLINSNFAEPVNQRGKSVYSEQSGYTIDMWKANSTRCKLAISANNKRIELSNISDDLAKDWVYQIIQNPIEVGKTYTIAVNVAGVVYAKSVKIVDTSSKTELTIKTGQSIALLNTTLSSGNAWVFRMITGTSEAMYVKWIALYEGDYTAETLPAYIAPDYHDEYLRCQRYLVAIRNSYASYAGYMHDASTARITIPIHTKPINNTPTLYVDGDYSGMRMFPANVAPAAAPIVAANQIIGNAIVLAVPMLADEDYPAGTIVMLKPSVSMYISWEP